LLLGAVFAEELKQAGNCSRDVVPLAELVPYAIAPPTFAKAPRRTNGSGQAGGAHNSFRAGSARKELFQLFFSSWT
jgi:hypothetical protein